MVRAPRTFHDRTLWPEFKALSDELDKHLGELTQRVIREAIHADVSEASESPTMALPERTESAERAASQPAVDGPTGAETSTASPT